jgi:hypothetical protein
MVSCSLALLNKFNKLVVVNLNFNKLFLMLINNYK